MRALPLIATICCLVGGGSSHKAAGAEPANVCEEAALSREEMAGLPAGLLLAIGRVESGRWDERLGRVAPWPWTINAAGRGMRFETKDDAIRAVKSLQEAGTRSIDVGCFQINLLHHPAAFTDQEDGFDPAANARYAARFLGLLFARGGTWESAVAAYHSADPVRGFAYRQLVFASWTPMNAPARAVPPPFLAIAPPRLPMPTVVAGVHIWTPMGSGARVVVMPGSEGTPSEVPVIAPAMPGVLIGRPPAGAALSVMRRR